MWKRKLMFFVIENIVSMYVCMCIYISIFKIFEGISKVSIKWNLIYEVIELKNIGVGR